MKRSPLLAVLGHYDSRGGTTAVRLDERSREAVLRAMVKYDTDVFGIVAPGDEIKTTAYGMEARQVDKLIHAMMSSDSPAVDDFLYVAELHYGQEHQILIDEHSIDFDEPPFRVLIERVMNTRLDHDASKSIKWPDLVVDHYIQTIGDKDFHYEVPSKSSLIDESLKSPVQLELIDVPQGWNARSLALNEELHDLASKEGLWVRGFSTEWTPEQIAKVKAWQKRLEEAEARDEADLVTNTANLPDMVLTRWDDDAYGFVIC